MSQISTNFKTGALTSEVKTDIPKVRELKMSEDYCIGKAQDQIKVPVLQLKPIVSENVTSGNRKPLTTDSSSQENSRKRIETEGKAAP